jgi:hypothetical protein
MICGAGVLAYSILKEDDFGSAIRRWNASRRELWLLKSGIEYSRISRAESGPVRRRSTPSRAGFEAPADREQNLWAAGSEPRADTR